MVQDGLEVPFETPRTVRAELRALLGLRDRAKRLLAAEAESLRTRRRSPASGSGSVATTRTTSGGGGRSTASRNGAPAGWTRTRERSGWRASRRRRSERCAATRSRHWSSAWRCSTRRPRTAAAGGTAARAGRRTASAGAGGRHPAGRARGVPGHPRPRRPGDDRATARRDDRRPRGHSSASWCTTRPTVSWSRPPNTCPGTSGRSSTRRAARQSSARTWR